jgi:predicted AAA+ superfamily ATPase
MSRLIFGVREAGKSTYLRLLVAANAGAYRDVRCLEREAAFRNLRSTAIRVRSKKWKQIESQRY